MARFSRTVLDITCDALFFLSAILSVVSRAVRVKGALGGIASVHCSYQKGNENNPKYFSKGASKTQLVSHAGAEQQILSGGR